MLLSYFFTCDL